MLIGVGVAVGGCLDNQKKKTNISGTYQITAVHLRIYGNGVYYFKDRDSRLLLFIPRPHCWQPQLPCRVPPKRNDDLLTKTYNLRVWPHNIAPWPSVTVNNRRTIRPSTFTSVQGRCPATPCVLNVC